MPVVQFAQTSNVFLSAMPGMTPLLDPRVAETTPAMNATYINTYDGTSWVWNGTEWSALWEPIVFWNPYRSYKTGQIVLLAGETPEEPYTLWRVDQPIDAGGHRPNEVTAPIGWHKIGEPSATITAETLEELSKIDATPGAVGYVTSTQQWFGRAKDPVTGVDLGWKPLVQDIVFKGTVHADGAIRPRPGESDLGVDFSALPKVDATNLNHYYVVDEDFTVKAPGTPLDGVTLEAGDWLVSTGDPTTPGTSAGWAVIPNGSDTISKSDAVSMFSLRPFLTTETYATNALVTQAGQIWRARQPVKPGPWDQSAWELRYSPKYPIYVGDKAPGSMPGRYVYGSWSYAPKTDDNRYDPGEFTVVQSTVVTDGYIIIAGGTFGPPPPADSSLKPADVGPPTNVRLTINDVEVPDGPFSFAETGDEHHFVLTWKHGTPLAARLNAIRATDVLGITEPTVPAGELEEMQPLADGLLWVNPVSREITRYQANTKTWIHVLDLAPVTTFVAGNHDGSSNPLPKNPHPGDMALDGATGQFWTYEHNADGSAPGWVLKADFLGQPITHMSDVHNQTPDTLNIEPINERDLFVNTVDGTVWLAVLNAELLKKNKGDRRKSLAWVPITHELPTVEVSMVAGQSPLTPLVPGGPTREVPPRNSVFINRAEHKTWIVMMNTKVDPPMRQWTELEPVRTGSKVYVGAGKFDPAHANIGANWGMPVGTVPSPLMKGNEPEPGDCYFDTTNGDVTVFT